MTTKEGGEESPYPSDIGIRETLAHEQGWWLDEIQHTILCDAGIEQALSRGGCLREGGNLKGRWGVEKCRGIWYNIGYETYQDDVVHGCGCVRGADEQRGECV